MGSSPLVYFLEHPALPWPYSFCQLRREPGNPTDSALWTGWVCCQSSTFEPWKIKFFNNSAESESNESCYSTYNYIVSIANLGLRLNSLYKWSTTFAGTSKNSFLNSLSRSLGDMNYIISCYVSSHIQLWFFQCFSRWRTLSSATMVS